MKILRVCFLIFFAFYFQQYTILACNNKPVGLINCGNSCYLNSILQSLIKCDVITNLLLNQKSQDYYTVNTLPSIYRNFVNDYDKECKKQTPNPLNTETIYNIIWPTFGNNSKKYTQQDAQEALLYILNTLFEATSKNFFQFDMTKSLKDYFNISSQTLPSKRSDATPVLSLSIIETATSIQETLIQKQQDGTKDETQTYLNAPEYLIVHLKIFKQNPNGSMEKILYTQNLNINDLKLPNKELNIYNYELFASSWQSGTLTDGHYIAIVKSGLEWYECNDSTINIITTDDFQNGKFKDTDFTPYLLFYKNKLKIAYPNLQTNKDFYSFLKTLDQSVLQQIISANNTTDLKQYLDQEYEKFKQKEAADLINLTTTLSILQAG